MGKLPGWAKTKLAAEDNSAQQVSLSVCLFGFFSSVCRFDLFQKLLHLRLRTRKGPGSPVGPNVESSSHSRFPSFLMYCILAFVSDGNWIFGYLYSMTIVFPTATGGGGGGLQQHGLSSDASPGRRE